MTHANGALAQHDYDAAGRLTALRNLKSDLSAISEIQKSRNRGQTTNFLDNPGSGVRGEAANVLRAITKMDFRLDASAWQGWWEAEKAKGAAAQHGRAK